MHHNAVHVSNSLHRSADAQIFHPLDRISNISFNRNASQDNPHTSSITLEIKQHCLPNTVMKVKRNPELPPCLLIQDSYYDEY